jgi:hypothetical protein
MRELLGGLIDGKIRSFLAMMHEKVTATSTQPF